MTAATAGEQYVHVEACAEDAIAHAALKHLFEETGDRIVPLVLGADLRSGHRYFHVSAADGHEVRVYSARELQAPAAERRSRQDRRPRGLDDA